MPTARLGCGHGDSVDDPACSSRITTNAETYSTGNSEEPRHSCLPVPAPFQSAGQIEGTGNPRRTATRMFGNNHSPTIRPGTAPDPHRILTVDNNVIYREDTVCLRRG